ncbi:hypothetical protein [Helicobacter cetorum]|uniref:hypothetical protein n=1 Tax=Helicobacter cetorum TaxID=138563 RepID=UPI000CF0FF86|nr:hypothetical protein [Helicobacter cetorum]
MKFLGKWFLLLFIGLSSLVFVGCEQESYKHMSSHSDTRYGKAVRGFENEGFSHGTSVFFVIVLIALGVLISSRNK